VKNSRGPMGCLILTWSNISKASVSQDDFQLTYEMCNRHLRETGMGSREGQGRMEVKIREIL